MNQRSFFKSLALIGAAAVGCPGIFIPRFEPVKWKVTPRIQRCLFTAYPIDQEPIFDPRVFGGRWQFVVGEQQLKPRWSFDDVEDKQLFRMVYEPTAS